jgi:hypothetical protein
MVPASANVQRAATSRPSPRRSFGALAALLSATVSIAAAGCASAAPYNPESLRADQLARVETICQSVMGLSPSEPYSPVWGSATNPGLTGGENHYQGCIASLSASLRTVDSAKTAWQANQDCVAQGFRPDSPDLAECVLRSLKTRPAALPPVAEPVSITMTPPKGSFFTASGREVRNREERACAALGLNPAYGGFDNCVKTLGDTFDLIDNPLS